MEVIASSMLEDSTATLDDSTATLEGSETLSRTSTHFTGFDGASTLHTSACADTPDDAKRRLEAVHSPRANGLLWCLQELLASSCIPFRDLAEFYYGWHTSVGTLTPPLLRGFRNILLSEGYAVIVRVGVILFLDELFWVLLHRGLPVYLVPVQSATSEQRNLVAVLHGTRPGSWTPFLQFVLEREAGACGRLRQDRYDFFATFSSLRPLLCKFDRAALDVLLFSSLSSTDAHRMAHVHQSPHLAARISLVHQALVTVTENQDTTTSQAAERVATRTDAIQNKIRLNARRLGKSDIMRDKTRKLLELTQIDLQRKLERLQEHKERSIKGTAKRIQAQELALVKTGLNSLLRGNRHGKIKGSANMQHYVAAHLDEISTAHARRHQCVLEIGRSRMLQTDLWVFAAEYSSLCVASAMKSGTLCWQEAVKMKKRSLDSGQAIDLALGLPDLVNPRQIMKYAKPGDARKRENARRLRGQGLGLFRMTTPAKKIFIPPIHLRYIRTLRKNIRLVLHSNQWKENVVDWEDDDHAYMAFDRQIGNRGGRSGQVLTVDKSKTGVWQKDFSDPALHITPWSCRIRSFSATSDRLIPSSDDIHIVITRPKYFRPSTATQAWNDRLQARYLCPNVWEKAPSLRIGMAPLDRAQLTACLRIQDQCVYFRAKYQNVAEQLRIIKLANGVHMTKKQKKIWTPRLSPSSHLRYHLQAVLQLYRVLQTKAILCHARLAVVCMDTVNCLTRLSEGLDEQLHLCEHEAAVEEKHGDADETESEEDETESDAESDKEEEQSAEEDTEEDKASENEQEDEGSEKEQEDDDGEPLDLTFLSVLFDDTLFSLAAVLQELRLMDLPTLRKIVFHSPDRGPGQGFHFHEVQARVSEVVVILELDAYILGPPAASHDNGVEQTNAAVTEAGLQDTPTANRHGGRYVSVAFPCSFCASCYLAVCVADIVIFLGKSF